MMVVKERVDPYFEENYITREYHIYRYTYARKFLKGKVLDVGCGAGFGCEILQKSCEKVIGIDISRDAIKHARKHYKGDFV